MKPDLNKPTTVKRLALALIRNSEDPEALREFADLVLKIKDKGKPGLTPEMIATVIRQAEERMQRTDSQGDIVNDMQNFVTALDTKKLMALLPEGYLKKGQTVLEKYFSP